METSDKIRVVFSRENVADMLSFFDKAIDKKGYIVYKKTGEAVLSNELEPIKAEELGCILPGSEVFIKAESAGLAKYFEETLIEQDGH